MLRTLQGEGEANELEVGEEGAVEDWAQFAQRLLQVRRRHASTGCGLTLGFYTG